jgi:hypothetical protein
MQRSWHDRLRLDGGHQASMSTVIGNGRSRAPRQQPTNTADSFHLVHSSLAVAIPLAGVTSSSSVRQVSHVMSAAPAFNVTPSRHVFGCRNVQSANNKAYKVIDMQREHSLDVLRLCETWHDKDLVSIRRRRCECMQVLECARSRTDAKQSSPSPVHGGVTLAAGRGVRLMMINN